MLDLRRNRVDYTGGLLAPPDGFHFECAVATTYSLDLETLLAVLLPLAFGNAPDNPETCTDGLLLLRALKHVAPRLTVFHQAGQIPMPHSVTPLHMLLDRILVPFPLPPPSEKRPPAFHPKTWTIEFRNDLGESRYRFLVLSRNLSRDDSLDISLSLESGTDRRQTRRTGPLLDFLEFLDSKIPPGFPHARDHKRRISRLSKGLATHPLTLGEDAWPWEDFDIFPLFDDASHRALDADSLFSGRPSRVVAMSPFLSESVVQRLAKHAAGNLTLLTRPDAYARLNAPLRHSVKDAWALKDILTTPGPIPGPDTETPRDTDLHAKLYLRESPSGNALLLGSMNATDSGLWRNIEMMVRLRSAPNAFGCDDLLKGLFGKKDNPFEKLNPDTTPSPADDAMKTDRDAAQGTIDAFCRYGATGRVETDGARHAVVVEISSAFLVPAGVQRCTLRPLGQNRARPTPAQGTVRFGGLALAEFSPLFVLAAETASCTLERVVHVPLDGLVETARDEAVIQAVVDAGGGWGACLGMFFTPVPYTVAESRQGLDGSSTDGPAARRNLSGLYEDMLRTAAEPGGTERFADLEIDALLARQTGPEALRARELLALFRQVLPKHRSRP